MRQGQAATCANECPVVLAPFVERLSFLLEKAVAVASS
jgi:hypothetical protein